MNWQQLATPPEVLCSALLDAIEWAHAAWQCGMINYSEFLYNLDDIFECLEGL